MSVIAMFPYLGDFGQINTPLQRVRLLPPSLITKNWSCQVSPHFRQLIAIYFRCRFLAVAFAVAFCCHFCCCLLHDPSFGFVFCVWICCSWCCSCHCRVLLLLPLAVAVVFWL